MDSFHLYSFGIGFASGVAVAVLVMILLNRGNIRLFSWMGVTIETHPPAHPEPSPTPGEQQIDITVSGRWFWRSDLPNQAFLDQQSQYTPGQVTLRPGEVYRFDSDGGLTDTGVNGLLMLAAHPQVRELHLYNCIHVTEAGLCQIGRGFRDFWLLDLRGTRTTDQVLDALHPMTSLQELDLRGINVSPEAVARLRASLPNCRVRWRASKRGDANSAEPIEDQDAE
jgi:hypothetical protein